MHCWQVVEPSMRPTVPELAILPWMTGGPFPPDRAASPEDGPCPPAGPAPPAPTRPRQAGLQARFVHSSVGVPLPPMPLAPLPVALVLTPEGLSPIEAWAAVASHEWAPALVPALVPALLPVVIPVECAVACASLASPPEVMLQQAYDQVAPLASRCPAQTMGGRVAHPTL